MSHVTNELYNEDLVEKIEKGRGKPGVKGLKIVHFLLHPYEEKINLEGGGG